MKLAIIKHFKKSSIIKEEWKGRLQGINEVCCAQQIYSELNSWRRDAVHNITTKGTKLYNELTEDKKKKTIQILQNIHDSHEVCSSVNPKN